MLFRKKMEPRCAYCDKGTRINETEVACVKRGIVSVANSCGSFRYDPLKRVPPRPVTPDFCHLDGKDFTL